MVQGRQGRHLSARVSAESGAGGGTRTGAAAWPGCGGADSAVTQGRGHPSGLRVPPAGTPAQKAIRITCTIGVRTGLRIAPVLLGAADKKTSVYQPAICNGVMMLDKQWSHLFAVKMHRGECVAHPAECGGETEACTPIRAKLTCPQAAITSHDVPMYDD